MIADPSRPSSLWCAAIFQQQGRKREQPTSEDMRLLDLELKARTKARVKSSEMGDETLDSSKHKKKVNAWFDESSASRDGDEMGAFSKMATTLVETAQLRRGLDGDSHSKGHSHRNGERKKRKKSENTELPPGLRAKLHGGCDPDRDAGCEIQEVGDLGGSETEVGARLLKNKKGKRQPQATALSDSDLPPTGRRILISSPPGGGGALLA